jgi:hypothetical protein
VRTPFITFLTWDDSQDRLALIPIAEAVAPPPTALTTWIAGAGFGFAGGEAVGASRRCTRRPVAFVGGGSAEIVK